MACAGLRSESGCVSDSVKDRHPMVSQHRITERKRNSVYKRTIEIWKRKKLRTVSEYVGSF